MVILRNISLFGVALMVAACGIKRPLIKPKDIPAYEEAQKKKAEQYKEDSQIPDEEEGND